MLNIERNNKTELPSFFFYLTLWDWVRVLGNLGALRICLEGARLHRSFSWKEKGEGRLRTCTSIEYGCKGIEKSYVTLLYVKALITMVTASVVYVEHRKKEH